MIQALIIEDEKPSARRLQRMLEKEGIRALTVLHSVEEAIGWFENNNEPELIFLDIQLSDGICFEIFEAVEISAAIIFTTAYDEYALKAFKLNSVDYLMKPIDEDELHASVQKYKKNRFNSGFLNISKLRAVLDSSALEYRERFTVQLGQHLKMIKVEDISCFFSENKSSYLSTTYNRNFPVELSLDRIEAEIDPKIFFRVNRSFIVNLSAISDIITYSNQRLEIRLKNYQDQQIIVSRERVKEFKNWIA